MSIDRSPFDLAQEAVSRIRQLNPLQPILGAILGSGLGNAVRIDDAIPISYSDIPHFPRSTVPGHAGNLYLGSVGDVPVAILSGRAHLYEGYTAQQVTFAVRVLLQLGCEALLLTNAAGGVNAKLEPGTLMLLTDHINLTGDNPLLGPNDDRLGVRFPDMSEVYSPRLQELVRRASTEVGVPVAEGVYMGLRGPSFETPAEIRMYRALGADAVGMSTVLEAIAAVHMGMEVVGISCITNMAAGMLPQRLTHEEVMETGERVKQSFACLVERLMTLYGNEARGGTGR